MTDKMKTITVFGSSRPEEGHAEYTEAVELGRALAAEGFAVCTGGYGGVMEGVSRGAREAGGRVLAVTSSFFRRRANRWVDEETPMATWQERLFELVRLGDLPRQLRDLDLIVSGEVIADKVQRLVLDLPRVEQR